jgi:CheY-like chemotaxis protein
MGFVDVVSAPQRGSTFYVYLPVPKSKSLDAAGIPAGAPEHQRPSAAGHGETILFVEDELRQLKLMQNFLEAEGYVVIPARDGAEAVETYRKHKDEISVVVLDIGLPKLNGWEAFMKIRAEQPDVKVIFATGYMSAEMESGVAHGELSGLIMKPYQLDDVLAKISYAAKHQPLAMNTDYRTDEQTPVAGPASKTIRDS